MSSTRRLWEKLVRRVLLQYGKRSSTAQLLSTSRSNAAKSVKQAVQHSIAYRQLLLERGLSPDTLDPVAQWEQVPVLTKSNTFGRFSLTQLARPLDPARLADVLTSSGRGSAGFGYKLTERRQHESSWFGIDLGLQDAFGVDQVPTLLVNCLPMGVTFRSRAVTVANVSVREDMACAILREIGPHFGQTIICTDPLFLKHLLDYSINMGMDWQGLKTSVILGEEMLVESQRDYFREQLGITNDETSFPRMVASSFGVGELGLNLLFETRETILVRKLASSDAGVMNLIAGSGQHSSPPAVFCFNPLRCWIEVVNPDMNGVGELCFTMNDPNAVISLPRYTTGDLGRLLTAEEVKRCVDLCGTSIPWLPVVAVFGRIKDRASQGLTVEDVKEMMYADRSAANCLTGAFRIGNNVGGAPQVTFQANRRLAMPIATLQDRIQTSFSALGISGSPVTVVVSVVECDHFPWRPVLDFERKFAYVDSPPAMGAE